MTRTGVVGHVEWVEFAQVAHVPVAGEIVHARHTWELPAGGGAVAAAQLGKLSAEAPPALLLTALGGDELGRHARAELEAMSQLSLHAADRPEPQRRAFTFLDDSAERTITVIGGRMVPHGDDPLPWERLAELDAVYFTAGDVNALRAARAAQVLVATPRALPTLQAAGVELDVLVSSGTDPGERYEPGMIDPPPRVVLRTLAAAGGEWLDHTGTVGRWTASQPPGPAVDTYGCGDSFAAGLTHGLGAGLALPAALELGARCGAACLTGRGPYAGQLTAG